MITYIKRAVPLVLTGLLLMSVAQANPAQDLAEKMLAALGGAEAWRDAAVVHPTAVNHHPQARLPYIQEYWYFTKAPRHVVKINNHDMQRMRSYTEAGGWSIVEGDVRPFSEERLSREILSWQQSIWHKMSLLAKGSADLRLTMADDGSVEFYESGQFIGWIEIGEDGAPRRHGGIEDRSIYTEFDGA